MCRMDNEVYSVFLYNRCVPFFRLSVWCLDNSLLHYYYTIGLFLQSRSGVWQLRSGQHIHHDLIQRQQHLSQRPFVVSVFICNTQQTEQSLKVDRHLKKKKKNTNANFYCTGLKDKTEEREKTGSMSGCMSHIFPTE